MFIVDKIVSGGQTGVDRAALDAAMSLEILHGGWCPKGRKSESGEIPNQYHLKETKTDNCDERTVLNIIDSDGTLIILPDRTTKITDGTNLTRVTAIEKKKPLLEIYLSDSIDPDAIVKWVTDHKIKVLNIAGPKESQSPNIYNLSLIFLKKVFSSFLVTKNESSQTSSSSYLQLDTR